MGSLATFFDAPTARYAWLILICAVGLLALSADSFRRAISGIYVDDDGVTVKTRFHNHHLDWMKIRAFRLRKNPGYLSKIGLDVILTNGLEIGAVGFAWRSQRELARAEEIVDALERRRGSAERLRGAA